MAFRQASREIAVRPGSEQRGFWELHYMYLDQCHYHFEGRLVPRNASWQMSDNDHPQKIAPSENNPTEANIAKADI